MSTTATANNNEVPFPFQQEDNDATMLHPRVEVKLNVAKRIAEIKTHLPFKTTQGQSLLEKLASGTLDDYIAGQQPTSQDNDSWLNSGPPIQEHLEMPKWLKDLSAAKETEWLQHLDPIKEPPEIDAEQLQKVKEGLDKLKKEAEEKLRSSNERNEHSLLDTGLVEVLMTPQPTSQIDKIIDEPMQAMQAEPAMPNAELCDEIIEATPTECIPVVRASTPPLPVQEKPVVQDPITPIPDILAPESNPGTATVTQIKPPPTFRQSDSIKLKETHHQATGVNPLNEMYGFIIDHEREHQKHPDCIQVSIIFNKILEDDVWKVKRTIFSGYLPYVGSTGIVYIEVIPVPKLKLSPKRVICISKG
jgi:hypothetical protein